MLSFTTMASPEWDGKTAIKKAREYGFQGVDLRISDRQGELKLSSTDSEIKELKKIFQEEGIIASSVLSYNTQASADAGSWTQMRDSVLRNLDIGTKLGTRLVRIFIGNPDVANDHEGFIVRAGEVLTQVLERECSPTSLVIQNHTGGVGVGDILNIIKRVDHPRLKMVLCPANALCMNEAVMDWIPALREHLPQVYVSDQLKGGSDQRGHGKTVLPGKGCLDFRTICQALGGEHYSGWISFKWEKIWKPELPGPEIALPYFVEYMKQLGGHDHGEIEGMKDEPEGMSK